MSVQGATRTAETPARTARTLDAVFLGRVAYEDGLRIQQEHIERRRQGVVPDTLLLLEHPHVITLGTSAEEEHVLLDPAQRALLGIQLFETGRGGDVTYHGPGQLVGYPIFALEPERRDLHRYVRDLEEVLIRTLEDFDIEAGRVPGRTGVWTRGAKIAAIGVRVSSGWITSHGWALNVSTDLRFFDAIVPCGIRDASVTSIAQCTGETVPLDVVAEHAAKHTAELFGRASNGMRRHPERLAVRG